eukprot:gene31454-9342_t
MGCGGCFGARRADPAPQEAAGGGRGAGWWTDHIAAKSSEAVREWIWGAGIPLPADACELLRGPPDVCERTGLGAERTARICRNLGRCADALLYPVLERGVDLKRREAEEGGPRCEVSDFARACREAAADDAARLTDNAPPRRQGGSWQPLALLCLCVRSALLALGWLSGAVPRDCVSPGSSPVPPSALVPAIDDDDALGWMRYAPFFAFDAGTKGALLYVTATLYGCRRVAAPALPRDGAGGAPDSGGLSRLCPQFAGESGEGHGPRKELFDLAAHELRADWAAEVSGESIGATAALQQSSAHVIVT